MPTASYSLHFNTALSTYEVLEALFHTDDIDAIAGAGVLYTRGKTFLAHARVTETTLAEKFTEDFGVRPTVSVNFFPDGVSSVNTAFDALVEAALLWMNANDDDFLLLANKDTLVLKYQRGKLTLNRSVEFWTPPRISLLDTPYTSV